MKTNPVFNTILALALLSVFPFHPSNAATDDEKAASKEANFVIVNRLEDFAGNKKRITGIYIVSASGKKLRGNASIVWGDNLLDSPLDSGDYVAMFIDTEKSEWFDWRIDIEGTDSTGKPLQYFHPSSHLFRAGTIVHHAVVSTADGTSPWTMATRIIPTFASQK